MSTQLLARKRAASLVSLYATSTSFAAICNAFDTSEVERETAYQRYTEALMAMTTTPCLSQSDASAAIECVLKEFIDFYGTPGACAGDDLIIGLLSNTLAFLKSEA